MTEFAKLTNEYKKYIGTIAKEYNNCAEIKLNEVEKIIKILNGFLCNKIELNDKEIENNIGTLVGMYFITFDIPLEMNIELVRAVKYKEEDTNKPYYKDISRLSYIPYDSKYKVKLGRFNKKKEPTYYCSISKDFNYCVNTALAEIDTKENDYVNILISKPKENLTTRYIGIFDKIRRGEELPSFINPIFIDIYKYMENKLYGYVFVAFQIVDAFFADIISRKSDDRLYKLTSILGLYLLEDEKIDALAYLSTQSKMSFCLAIKPSSVDKKIKHEKVLVLDINKVYSYSIYEAPIIHEGKVNNGKVYYDTI